MTYSPVTAVPADFDSIADRLETDGYCILPNVIPDAALWELYKRVVYAPDDSFRRAGIGRESDFQIDHEQRTDSIRWLTEKHPAEAGYLQWMEQLRLALNRRLFLGLFEYEAHFAHYAPGGFYKKHFDAFAGDTNRVLSSVMYLNPDWQADWGGELLLYDNAGENVLKRVVPEFGCFLLFLSERFPHEVCPSARDRYSIAGWFRVRQPL